MDPRHHHQKTLDRLYADFLGRRPAPDETIEEWRSAGRRRMRDITMQARARCVIAVAQHMANKAEIEAAHIIEWMKISSRFTNP